MAFTNGEIHVAPSNMSGFCMPVMLRLLYGTRSERTVGPNPAERREQILHAIWVCFWRDFLLREAKRKASFPGCPYFDTYVGFSQGRMPKRTPFGSVSKGKQRNHRCRNQNAGIHMVYPEVRKELLTCPKDPEIKGDHLLGP